MEKEAMDLNMSKKYYMEVLEGKGENHEIITSQIKEIF